MTEFLNSLDPTSVFFGFLFFMYAEVLFGLAACLLEKAFALRKARIKDKLNTPNVGEKEVRYEN